MTQDELKTTARRLYGRVLMSVVAFLTFIAFAINAFLIEQTGKVGVLAIIPLAIALLVLPRRNRSEKVAVISDDSEENQEMRALQLRLNKISGLTSNLRLVYLILVFAVFFALPSLIPAPS